MLWTPVNSFSEFESNWDTPSSNMGATVTAGANDAKGAWTDLLGGVTTHASWGIRVHLHQFHASASPRPILADIGIDVAGGTSYTVLIPDLNASCAGTLSQADNQNNGFHYFFPVFIPAGSRIAARAQVGNTATEDGECCIVLHQKPSHPEMFKFGSFVDGIGIDSVNSRGVDITASIGLNSAEGSWVSLGVAPREAWWAQCSLSIDDPASSGFTSTNFLLDLAVGSATAKRLIAKNLKYAQASSNDQVAGELMPYPQGFCRIPAGATLYARASTWSATLDANIVYTAMAYTLGG